MHLYAKKKKQYYLKKNINYEFYIHYSYNVHFSFIKNI